MENGPYGWGRNRVAVGGGWGRIPRVARGLATAGLGAGIPSGFAEDGEAGTAFMRVGVPARQAGVRFDDIIPVAV